MPNFDRKLRQSIWYVPTRATSGKAQIAVPEEKHPLVTISPQFWTWDAGKVLQVFALLGVLSKSE